MMGFSAETAFYKEKIKESRIPVSHKESLKAEFVLAALFSFRESFEAAAGIFRQ